MKKKIYAAALGGIFVLLGAGYAWSRAASAARGAGLEEGRAYAVAHVVDGDTFAVRDGARERRVRILGVDAPETVDPRKPVGCYGPEASAETHALLDGRSVELSFNPDRELKDKYGRYLAYVHRDDGLFVNEALLRGGYAREYTFGKPYSLQKEFRALESEARERGAGLWGACEGAGSAVRP